MNMIPKDGGNILSGSVYAGFTDGGWQADNFTQEHSADLGLESNQGVNNIYDVNPAHRRPDPPRQAVVLRLVPGHLGRRALPRRVPVPTFRSDATRRRSRSYFRNPSATNPALSGVEDAVLNQYVHSGLLRLTSQLGPRNKVSAYLDRIFKFKDREFTATVEPIRAAGQPRPGARELPHVPGQVDVDAHQPDAPRGRLLAGLRATPHR